MIELKNKVNIIYPTKVVMRIKIIIAWSWKKINCSIRGEALSCKPKNPHVAIFYGNIWFHNKILNLIHYSATIELNSKFMM